MQPELFAVVLPGYLAEVGGVKGVDGEGLIRVVREGYPSPRNREVAHVLGMIHGLKPGDLVTKGDLTQGAEFIFRRDLVHFFKPFSRLTPDGTGLGPPDEGFRMDMDLDAGVVDSWFHH